MGKIEKGDNMTPRHFNVLFLWIGNSARSIMAEAITNRKGFPNFTAFSAGSHPTGRVNPQALKQIETGGMPVEGLRSKSWNEFEKSDGPKITLFLTYATAPLMNRTRSGRVNPWPRGGASRIRQRLLARMIRFNGHISKPTEFLIAGSLCSFLCR
jgi:hypothetical protein